ncbi:MAG: 1-phosphofructokinase [Cardiobacteriaceae bacterium]|nr:1-phosphofructokinase [Cardiobacteriaceae bacterium]
MKPVITVTANPALDLTINAKGWQRGVVNRGESMTVTPGGKGVSVAINLMESGVDALVTGWMGEGNDIHFTREFRMLGMRDEFIRIPGDIRRNVKIIDQGETTDFNLPGEVVPEKCQQALINFLDRSVPNASMLVMGGSLPPSVDKDFYAKMVKRYRGKCDYIVVDTSDKALIETMNADVLPDIIKPNIHELQTLVGRAIESDEDILAAAREFLARGMKMVVVSMGERGAWFVKPDEALHATPPKVKVASTVGAGDAMVAGVVRGILNGRDLEHIARTATAFSAGNITVTGVQLPSQERIEELKAKVVIRRAD